MQKMKANTVSRKLENQSRVQSKIGVFRKNFIRDWQLYLLIMIPAIYVLIFNYGPMYGVQIAFRDYNPKDGITGSPWVGLEWFRKFITNYQFKDIFSNTVMLSLYSMLVGFPLPIIFALLLNSIRSEKFKRVTQTVSYMPHFISLTVIVSILNMVLSPVNGLYGNLFRLFGGTGYPTDFRSSVSAFRHLYVWSGVWQEIGWDSIIYIAALSAVSSEIHEAAMIDGASRFKRILHVDLPAIAPTIGIMLILRCGSIISIGFEKVYLMQTSLNLEKSEVISTYIYKVGMGSFKDFSYGAAVGLFNTVINLALMLSVNYITKRMTDKEVSLF